MNTDLLSDVWQMLPAGAGMGQMAGHKVSSCEVWAAKDYAGQHHLLIEVGPEAAIPRMDTQGLHIDIVHCSVADNSPTRYLDLACADSQSRDAFAVVAADIAHVAETADDRDRDTAVARRISRWRWFWKSDPTRLSETDALGLFGELWFLRRWASAGAPSVAAWTGADGARHDFQWPQVSVEVKTASRRADGAVVHRVADLDQLNSPEDGQLYLFSLHVRPDTLATNSIATLADSLFASLASQPDTAEELARKLAQRGYTPLHNIVTARSYRILNEDLYRVDDEFPRLTPAAFPRGLPAGVTAVSYSVDTAACLPWRVATAPQQWSRP
ncbi:PD-(D/E)XK motif protein [Mycolicibacterium farcinogenes]|nr:PD-(D/E)XK motif protein [Mycolicibacterium farcinogenes]